MNRLLMSALMILLLGSPAPANAAVLTIVNDGQPRAAIVVEKPPADADAAQQKRFEQRVVDPARDLQVYIKKMSGAELPLLTEGDALPANTPVVIYVGHTAAAKQAGVRIPSGFNPVKRPEIYGEEGYVIQTKGSQIFLAGNQDGPYFGTTYAVSALLERLGCRWYFPGDWGEVIPQQKTVTVPELNVTAKPDFPMRVIWIDGRWGISNEDRAVYKTWCRRVGFSAEHMGKDNLYPVPGDGSLAQLLPPREYAETHPEFYAMGEAGQRPVTPKATPDHTMLCLSNDEMVTEYIKNVKEAFAGQRSAATVTEIGIGISPPDGVPYCYCENCKAASQNFNFPRYAHRTMQSEEVFTFGVKLAEAIPDKWVSVAAYALRDLPPQGIKLRPNMSVMHAPISCCVLHPNNDPTCWRRQEFVKTLKHWCRLNQHVWIYDYTQGFLVSQFEPERDVANIANNAPIYKQAGIKGFARQGSNAMMATWIGYYISARLMWDVHADVEAIKRDFYTTFFGPQAGPHIQAWWDACEAKLLEGKVHVHESWLVNHLYTAEFTRAICQHVDAARRAKMTENQRKRFTIFELIVENFEASTEMDEAVSNLDYGKAAACATRMLAARTKLNEISVFLIGKMAQSNKWGMFTLGRKLKYEELAAKTNGKMGEKVAALPLEARFRRDPFNVGITSEWYQPDLDDRDWGTKNTFYTWDAQDEPEDAVGHDYDGHGWYRTTIQIPRRYKDKPVRFYCGGAINEAWVWINGEYAGHKPHAIWWMGQNEFELDVTQLVRPGKNTIAIRVWNDTEIGGLLNRGFFWSPK